MFIYVFNNIQNNVTKKVLIYTLAFTFESLMPIRKAKIISKNSKII